MNADQSKPDGPSAQAGSSKSDGPFIAGLTAQLKPFLAYLAGQALSDVLLVKGHPGSVERDSGVPFSGADRAALIAALAALGWGEDNWCGVLLEPPAQAALSPAELRLVIEINDPELVMALDDPARQALLKAFGLSEANSRVSGIEDGSSMNQGHPIQTRRISTGGDGGGSSPADGWLEESNDIDNSGNDCPGEGSSKQARFKEALSERTLLEVGLPMQVLGRRLLAISDFESSLGNTRTKQLVWAQLKQARR